MLVHVTMSQLDQRCHSITQEVPRQKCENTLEKK